MHTNSISVREQKDKKKGMRLSLFIHIAIFALGIYPFLSLTNNEDPTPEQQAVAISFENFEMSSKRSAEKQASRTVSKKKKATKKAAPKKVETKAKPKPAPPKPPVMKTPEPETPIKTAPTKVEPVPDPAKAEPTPEEIPEEEPKEEVVIEEPVVEDDAPETPGSSKDKDDDVATDDVAGNAKDAGDSSTGKSKSTGKKDDGVNGDGVGWEDMGGDGIFNRRVRYHADVKKITKKEGKIVIRLCIDRQGRVTYADYDKDESTIKDKAILRKAVRTAKKYRFDVDYTAPKKQCGKLSFIFDLNE